MLMLFPTLQVPGLEDIEFFRDHKDANQFYALRSVPKVARDPEGRPMFNYLFISREANIAAASNIENKELIETQLGQLLFTVDLALTEEEHTLAAEYIKKIKADKHNAFIRIYNRLLKREFEEIKPEDMPEPKISTASSWKKGTAKLEILEGLPDTFKKSSSQEVKPSLVGSNSASFYATLGVEGSQMFYDAFTKGYAGTEDEVIPLQAIIRYDLTGYGLIPSLDIKVSARSREVYSHFKEEWETYSKSYRKNYDRRYYRNPWNGKWFPVDRSNGTAVSASQSDISKMVEEMWDSKVINIEMSDFSNLGLNNEEADELHTQIKTTLLNMITNTLIPQFFESGLTETMEEKADDDAGVPEEGGILNDNDKRQRRQYQSYYFREDIDVSKTRDLFFHFKENRAVDFVRFPNGTLSVDLTPEEREDVIKQVDITNPTIQVLNVALRVNADFEQDNIHSIVVNVKYSQKDHLTGVVRQRADSYIFRTGEEDYLFMATMAKDADGKLLDSYDVNAKINYKGVGQSPPEINLNNISERALVISYEKLGFVTVKVSAGDIDWKTVKDAIVELEYIAAPNKSDTRKEIRLSKDKLFDHWKSFQYGHQSKQYKYRKKYIYMDGTEAELSWQKDTKEELIIDDNLIGRVRASFDVILDEATVKGVKVEIVYHDSFNNVKEEHSHWFTQTDTWDWVIRLREGGTENFKYRYTTEYKDGITVNSDWRKGKSNEDIPFFQAKRYKKSLLIDGAELDWDVWKKIFMSVEHEDLQNDYHVSKRVRLTEDEPEAEVFVLGFNKKAVSFNYNLRFVGKEGERYNQESQTITGRNPVLILEEPILEEETD